MEQLALIEELIINGEYDKALEIIESLDEPLKESAKAQAFLGVISAGYELWAASEYYNLKALAIEPDNVDFMYNLAFVSYQLHNYKDAHILLSKLAKQDEELAKQQDFLELTSLVGKELAQTKNLLMISYFFPPLSGSGVFRSLKFAKYLPEFNWIPTVISAEKSPVYWNFSDDTLMDGYPAFLDVHRIPDMLSYPDDSCVPIAKVSSILHFLRTTLNEDPMALKIFDDMLNQENGMSNLITFPCFALHWAYDVINFLENNIDIKSINAIFTTSGPYSSHLVGYFLKKQYGVPWIADFRDEWSANPYAQNPGITDRQKLLIHLEKIILTSADVNLCVNECARENYMKNFNLSKEKIITITNGYDEADFKQISFDKPKTDKFRVIYSGLIYTKESSLVPLLNIIKTLIDENVIDKDRVEIVIVGVNDIDSSEEFLQTGMENHIVTFPYSEHHFALEQCVQSDLLLCAIGSHKRHNAVYTGKFFEYLRCGKPILALCPANGLVSKLLKELNTGWGGPIEDTKNVKKFIADEYAKWRDSKDNTYYTNAGIKRFERKELTRQLSDVLNRICRETPPAQATSVEIPSTVYDKIYETGGWNQAYLKHYSDSVYYPSWIEAAKHLFFIQRDKLIIDIGCGVGQFANLLFDYGFFNYHGIDFSEEAIKQAKACNHEHSEKFQVADGFKSDIFDRDYELAIFFEILEHLQQDLALLSRVKSNKFILMSVPNFSDPNHVRFFDNCEQVRERYSQVMDIFHVQEIPLSPTTCLYMVSGKRK